MDVNAWLTNLVKSFEVLVNTVETRPYGIDVWYRIVPHSATLQGLWCLSCNSWASHGHVRVAKLRSHRLTYQHICLKRHETTETFAYNLETQETVKQWLWWAFRTNMTSVTHMGHIRQVHLKHCKDTSKTCTLNLSTYTFHVMQCNVLYCDDTMVMIYSQKSKAYQFLLLLSDQNLEIWSIERFSRTPGFFQQHFPTWGWNPELARSCGLSQLAQLISTVTC